MKDIKLRILLVVLWIVLQLINGWWFTHVLDRIQPWLEQIIFSICAFIIVAALWFLLKRPDCVCWDDIRPESDKQAREVNEAIANQHPHRIYPTTKPWKHHDQGESFGHGGSNG